MGIFKNLAKVKAARLEMAVARREIAVPAASLLSRAHDHPLTTVGVAAGAGLVLGRLDVSPLRIPGLSGLISGGVAELVAQGANLVAGLSPEDGEGS